MSKIMTYLIVFVGILGFSFNVNAAELYGAKAAQQSAELTVESMLIYAIQDEYLARAEYEYIIEKYGAIRPFSNIIKSEENHIDMLKPLFAKYGFPIPEDTAKEHIFTIENLKQAFETGVAAEIDNIAMYEEFLTKPIPDDVRSVFQRLKNASENHLRAFQKGLSRY